MSLYIDLTEFLMHPKRTGIQRVAGELCRHMPPDIAVPIQFTSAGYIALSRDVIGAIAEYFKGDSFNIDKFQHPRALRRRPILRLLDDDTVLVPEVFFQKDRIAFFRTMAQRDFERHRFVVYDLLPLTHPEYFAADMPVTNVFGYFQTIRRSDGLGVYLGLYA